MEGSNFSKLSYYISHGFYVTWPKLSVGLWESNVHYDFLGQVGEWHEQMHANVLYTYICVSYTTKKRCFPKKLSFSPLQNMLHPRNHQSRTNSKGLPDSRWLCCLGRWHSQPWPAKEVPMLHDKTVWCMLSWPILFAAGLQTVHRHTWSIRIASIVNQCHHVHPSMAALTAHHQGTSSSLGIQLPSQARKGWKKTYQSLQVFVRETPVDKLGPSVCRGRKNNAASIIHQSPLVWKHPWQRALH